MFYCRNSLQFILNVQSCTSQQGYTDKGFLKDTVLFLK